MTAKRRSKPEVPSIEGLPGQNRALFKELLRDSLQQAPVADMTEAIEAEPGERTTERVGHPAGY